MHRTSRSLFFPSLCLCVRRSHHVFAFLSLPVFPALSHKPVSKLNQEAGESHELSLVVRSLLLSSPIIATFKDRTLRQRALSYTCIFHSFLSKMTLRPLRIDCVSHMFVFFFFFFVCVRRRGSGCSERGKRNSACYTVFFVFMKQCLNRCCKYGKKITTIYLYIFEHYECQK